MRRTPLKRKRYAKKSKAKGKEKGVGRHKKELWKVFSKFIRERDRYTCLTCGRVARGGGCHAGHYIPKSVGGLALYFHEGNVHAQCYHCNINLSGNSDIYLQKLVEKYGEAHVQELRRLRGITTKWSVEDYVEKINHYKERLNAEQNKQQGDSKRG